MVMTILSADTRTWKSKTTVPRFSVVVSFLIGRGRGSDFLLLGNGGAVESDFSSNFRETRGDTVGRFRAHPFLPSIHLTSRRRPRFKWRSVGFAENYPRSHFHPPPPPLLRAQLQIWIRIRPQQPERCFRSTGNRLMRSGGHPE